MVALKSFSSSVGLPDSWQLLSLSPPFLRTWENEGENSAWWQLISGIVGVSECAWLLQFAVHNVDDDDDDDGSDESHIAYTPPLAAQLLTAA